MPVFADLPASLFSSNVYDTLSPFSAKDVVFQAIAAGKHVVTANKALIAAFLPELQALLLANPTVRLEINNDGESGGKYIAFL